MRDEKYLEEFIKEKKIDAEVIKTDGDSGSSASAAETLGIAVENIAKTICIVADGEFMSVVLQGDKRINLERLRHVLGKNKIRLAHDEEIIKYTGFEKGGVPPVSYIGKFIVDSNLNPDQEVFCGGGSKNSVLRIKVNDIINLNKPMILNVSD
ncbi:MAG: YbaK/EbsC family protein [Candidatus Parvarchaeota archaeon]|nr:YbaK/EbsC family protein [Candidatus Parvarchaeota archaeon]